MRIFTVIVYILIGALVAWFAAQNWERTPLWLPGGYEAYWPLGAYIIAALLLGLVPLSIMHSLTRWRLNRRIAKLEQQVEARPAPTMSPPERQAPPPTPAI